MRTAAARRFFSAAVTAAITALFAVLLLAGCGGGGSSPVSTVFPTPSPIPVSSELTSVVPQVSESGVTVVANYDKPTLPVVTVTFTGAPTSVPIHDVVEYHVYRNDQIVGRFTQAEAAKIAAQGNTFVYQDTGKGSPFDYVAVGHYPVGLVQARSSGVGPFTAASDATIYRITLIYKLQKIGSEISPDYTEAEIGRSREIYLFR